MDKPKVRFCWECGRKLYGNHHRIAVVDGHPRTLHVQCHDELKEQGRIERSGNNAYGVDMDGHLE